MFKKTILFFVAVLIAAGTLTGCYKMGKATGEASEEIKEGSQEFKKGYEDGKKSD